MSITFKCEYCGKKIEAPDSAGGKWGKCPACKNKVYVPQPAAKGEELRLSPLDDRDEIARQKYLAEEARLREDILRETNVPDEPAQKGQEKTPEPTNLSDAELHEALLTYLRAMADGELEQAEQTAAFVLPCGARAITIMDRIALSEIPDPEISDVPPQVLSGLIRNLRERIKQ